MNFVKKSKAVVGAAVLAVAVPVASFAQSAPAAIDVSSFTDGVAAQQTSVTTVVGATFALLAIVVGVKYIRRAAK